MIQQNNGLPYVYYTVASKESKDADGHVTRDNEYTAHIVSRGSKDEHVHEAESWVEGLRQKGIGRGPFDTQAEEYGQVWYPRFRKMLDDFKAGEEMKHPGTSLRSILAFMKSEVAQAEAVHIYSLEDLAVANEEAIRHMGIGGRALKDKAVQLLASKDDNAMAEVVAAQRVEIDGLKERIEQFIAAGHSAKGRVKDKEPAA